MLPKLVDTVLVDDNIHSLPVVVIIDFALIFVFEILFVQLHRRASGIRPGVFDFGGHDRVHRSERKQGRNHQHEDPDARMLAYRVLAVPMISKSALELEEGTAVSISPERRLWCLP